MADIYVRSTDGSDADNGSTWALAKASLAGAAAIDAAGDHIWLSQSHSESNASAQTISLAGTPSNPVWVIAGVDSSAPPVTVSSTNALIKTTGTSAINVNGSGYFYNVNFEAASGSVNANLNINAYNTAPNSFCEFINCNFSALASGTSATLTFGGSAGANSDLARTILRNCGAKISRASNSIVVSGDFQWLGGSILSGNASTSALFSSLGQGRAPVAKISGVDFSNMDPGCSLVSAIDNGYWSFTNCTLPSAWTGSLTAGTVIVGFRAEMFNCDNGATNYRLNVVDFYGTVVDETTVVRTGGATDGTTPISWKMTSTADAIYPMGGLYSPPLSIWNDTTGTSKTLTVEILHDSVTALNNNELWIEVEYLGTASFPKSVFILTLPSDVLTSATPIATSSTTWTTTGLTNPNKQKISVTFTPQAKGLVTARVVLAKPSKIVWIDPEITIT